MNVAGSSSAAIRFDVGLQNLIVLGYRFLLFLVLLFEPCPALASTSNLQDASSSSPYNNCVQYNTGSTILDRNFVSFLLQKMRTVEQGIILPVGILYPGSPFSSLQIFDYFMVQSCMKIIVLPNPKSGNWPDCTLRKSTVFN